MINYMRIAVLALCALSASVGAAQAAAPPVPEIDPGMASSAIALLACGVLMLTRRLGRK